MFKALLLEKDDAGFRAGIRDVDEADLPAGEVLVRVEHSTLNYKDALAITNRSPIVRAWPMVAGIDGAGTVLESSHPAWKAGDRVVHDGWGVGETRWGCLAEKARLQGGWLVRLPPAFTTRQAMAIGTAGYTAMLCVLALEAHGVEPGDGEVLVTGATGGVGSIAVALLARLGHRVAAATGKADQAGYLKELGATHVIDRAELAAPGKPLQKERWAAAIDAVGSHTLVNALAQTRYRGVVAACGLAQGHDLPATVMPFILRGVTLVGIDSVMAPLSLRERAWQRLARDLDPARLDLLTSEVGLDGAIARAGDLLAGRGRGRVVVAISAPAASRRLNFGCSLLPSHSKIIISVVTTSAPSVRARSVAATRSAGRREPIGVGDPFHRMPGLDQAGDRLHHADVCLAAADDIGVAPGGEAMQEAFFGRGGEMELRERRVAEAADLRDERPEPVGILLGADDVDAELARGRRELDAAADDVLGIVDRRHQAFLRVDDEQHAVVGLAEDAHGRLLGVSGDFPPTARPRERFSSAPRQFVTIDGSARPGDKPC